MLGECPDTHIACRLFNSFCFYSSTAIILYECAWASKSPGIEHPAPFDRPFYLLINLAVGGTFDEQSMGRVTTALPAEFRMEYIRVFQ